MHNGVDSIDFEIGHYLRSGLLSGPTNGQAIDPGGAAESERQSQLTLAQVTPGAGHIAHLFQTACLERDPGFEVLLLE